MFFSQVPRVLGFKKSPRQGCVLGPKWAQDLVSVVAGLYKGPKRPWPPCVSALAFTQMLRAVGSSIELPRTYARVQGNHLRSE